MANTEPPQNIKPYDGMAKSSFGELAPQIIPCFIKRAFLPEDWHELNVELNRNTIAIDFGTEMFVEDEPDATTLNTELEVDPDEKTLPRVCDYSINLYIKYGRKVFSLLLLPFECKVPEPFRIVIAGHEFLKFNPIIICLWEIDPQETLDQEQWAIYMFLPAMNYPTTPQMKQAISELDTRLYATNRQQFIRCVGWFLTMLGRTTMVSDQDKQTMKEYIKMKYQLHPLMAEDPTIKGIIDAEIETRSAVVEKRWKEAEQHLQAAEQRFKEETEQDKQRFKEKTEQDKQRFKEETEQWAAKHVAAAEEQIRKEAERWAAQQAELTKQQAACAVAEAKQQAAEAECRAALAETALAKQQAAEAKQQAAEKEIHSLKELILDLAQARFSASVVSVVQQSIDFTKDVDRLKAFHHQLTLASSEDEVSTRLRECFPALSGTSQAAESIKELILDFIADHFAASTREAVQQRLTLVHNVEQLKAFFRQLTRLSDEREVPALLDRCFPTS